MKYIDTIIENRKNSQLDNLANTMFNVFERALRNSFNCKQFNLSNVFIPLEKTSIVSAAGVMYYPDSGNVVAVFMPQGMQFDWDFMSSEEFQEILVNK